MNPEEDSIKNRLGEQGAKLWRWFLEDPCFGTLILLKMFADTSDPQVKAVMQARIEEHERCCGKCPRNVRLSIARMEDPIKKEIYQTAFQSFLHVWLRLAGSQTRRWQGPEGCYYRTTFLEDRFPAPLPYTAIEVFFPSSVGKKGHVTYDVNSKELFEDPRPLLQHLDETAAGEVKAFPPDTGDLHWRTVFGEREQPLRVRFQGKVKEVARDWTLHGRYAKVVRKHLPKDSLSKITDGENASKRATLSDEVLLLEEMATKYQRGRSWFMGFLKKALANRGIDVFRRSSRDASTLAMPIIEGEDSGLKDGIPLSRLEVAGQMGRRSEGDKLIEELEPRQPGKMLAALRARLPDTEKQILDFKAAKLSDKAIAAQLGCARETVSRRWAKIKKTATLLKNNF